MKLVKTDNLIFSRWSSELSEDPVHAVGAWLLKPSHSRHLEGLVLTSAETFLVPNCITT